ncbi:MAG: hypothetical protein ACNA8W_14210 [Bradymonadaceae bacterium]
MRKMLLKLTGLVALVALTGTGCMNMSTLQTARALEAGESRILVGGGYFTSPEVNDAAEDVSGTDVTLSFPYLEAGYRRGIIPNLEAGAKLTIPGSIGLDAKYQFVDAGGFALATGGGLSYLSLTSGTGENEVSSTVIDLIVPVYASYDVGEYLSLYSAPKYILRMGSSTNSDGMSMGHLAGGSGGIRLGNRAGVFLEGTYMMDLTSDYSLFQGTGAVFFGF